MSKQSENNKKIAKNTILLYIRMLLTMVITLYTSRIVLNTIGIQDYGIYNVVGGIVAMFGFLNGAMSTSTQRYITFELGKNDFEKLSKVFNTSVTIHALLSLILFILAETIGFWFLLNKMSIPIERMDAAIWVYQGAILSTIVLIMSVPYNACIIAHERMKTFAYISILEVSLKLLIVYLLCAWNFDKLKLYAILMFCVQLIIRIIYSRYCKNHFQETRFKFYKDWKLFKEMLSFAGWNLWGNCAAIAFTQGLNILLNIFFGPIVNASRAIAVQAQTAVTQFSNNFQTALNPQITKSYAIGDYVYMHKLIFRSSRFTFLLLLFLTLPIQMEADTILFLWLKTVPEYSSTFLHIILCTVIVDATANPLMVSASATGKVKLYQSIIGGILLSILPLSYMTLKLGGSAESVFIVHLIVCILAFIIRLFIVRPMINLNIFQYFKEVIFRCFIVTVISLIFPILFKLISNESFINFILEIFICLISVTLSSFFCGLDKSEKTFIKNKFLSFF